MNKFKKWENQLIKNVDLSTLEWKVYDSLELRDFIQENYYDNQLCCFAYKKENQYDMIVPLFGLDYLNMNSPEYEYHPNCDTDGEYRFLLGTAKNALRKETIIAATVFIKKAREYAKYQPVTLISTMEVNQYFRRQGIYKRMCEVFYTCIDPDQHILTSLMSSEGQEAESFSILVETLKRSGFTKNIVQDDGYTDVIQYLDPMDEKDKIFVKE